MISKDKKYRTRDGKDVVIYEIYSHQKRCIHGAVCRGTIWTPRSWYSNGQYYEDRSPSPWDLIEVPKEIHRTAWINVYPEYMPTPTNTLVIYPSRAEADKYADRRYRIACVEVQIKCVEGQGL